jgi:hypothetical protein
MIYETDTDLVKIWNGSSWDGNFISSDSPSLTGVPTSPTATTGTNTTQIATTAFANSAGGLVFIKSQTVGNNVYSVTVSSAFSSTYDNYKILYSGGAGSANGDMNIQLSGGTSADYDSAITYVTFGSGSPQAARSVSQTSANWAGANYTGGTYCDITVMGPNLARHTIFNSELWRTDLGLGRSTSVHKVASAYTGFVLSSSSAMNGGVICVYGYRKS